MHRMSNAMTNKITNDPVFFWLQITFNRTANITNQRTRFDDGNTADK